MQHYRFLVESRPHIGRENEYHDWYDGQHSDDLLKLPGARSVQRFHTIEPENDTPSYFMIVDYETDDLGALLETIGSRARSSDMPSSSALDRDSLKITILAARGSLRANPIESVASNNDLGMGV